MEVEAVFPGGGPQAGGERAQRFVGGETLYMGHVRVVGDERGPGGLRHERDLGSRDGVPDGPDERGREDHVAQCTEAYDEHGRRTGHAARM